MAQKAKKNKKINLPPLLVVAEDKAGLSELHSLLEKAGFDSVGATPSDSSFKEKLSGHWGAIIITDALSGLIPKIREKRGLRQLPVLLVLAQSKKEPGASLLKGADDYLAAAAPAPEWRQRVKALIERSTRNVDAFTLQEGVKALEQIMATGRGGKTDFEALQFAAKELSRMYPKSKCSIIMIEQARNQAIVIAETRSEKELNLPLDLKNYPEIRNVIKTRKPLIINDVQLHPMMREVRKILATKSVHSLLLTPVLYQDELIGIILIRSIEEKHLYTQIDVYFSQLVSDSLAIALKNLRLSRRAREETREKEQAIHKALYSGEVSKRLEKLFEYASDGLVIISDLGQITGVNQNFLRFSGYERQELMAKNIEDLLEFEMPRPEPLIHWLGRKRRSGSSNLLVKLKPGDKKFVTTHIELLPGPRQEFLISVHDVTEERKLSLELRQTKEFLENLVQNSMEAIIAADTTGNIIVFNRAAENLTGYQAEEVLGRKNIVDLYAPGAARAIMKKLRSPFYGGPGRLETTHNILLGKSGQEIPINMSAAVIYDDQGREIASMGLYQDIRERIEIEKRLRQAQERLLESKRKEAVMALAGAAAHELNQPLTSILGYAEILKRVQEQLKDKLKIGERVLDPVKNAVKVISDQAERMAEVIKKLGDLTEFETREYAGKQKIVDLDRADRTEFNLERALSLVGEAVILMDPEMVILDSYGQAVQIFGENPEGKSLSRYLEGVNYATGVKLVEEAKNKDTAQDELDLRSAQNQVRRVSVRAEKVGEKELLMVIFDVDQLRKMQSQLKELVAFRGELFQNMPVPLAVLDEDGRIVHFSKEAERLFGWDLDEVKGKPPAVFMDDFKPAEFVVYLRKVRQEGKAEGSLVAKDKAGRKFEVYYFLGAMRDPGGAVVGYLVFMVDLSEKHLLEQALSEKTTYLDAISKNTAILVQSSDWQEALTSMLEQLARLFEFDIAVLIPVEPTERGFYFLSYYPKSGEKVFQEQRAFEQLEPAQIWLSSPEIRYHEDLSKIDFSRAPVDMQVFLEQMIKQGIVNFMSIPLKFQEEVVGRVFFGHRQPGYLKPEKIQPFNQFFLQLTIAVSQYRLYFKLEKQRLQLLQRNLFLERILEQSQKIDLRKEEAQIFLQFLNLFQEIFPRAHLWLAWKTETNNFSVRSVSNLAPELIGKQFAIDANVREKILAESKPVHFEPGSEFRGFLQDGQDIILAAIISESNLAGLLGVESHHREPFLEEEEFLLQLFSRYLALLIPNLLRIRESVLLKSFQESLIGSTNAFILMISQDNKIVIFNRAFQEKLELGDEDLHGMNTLEFVGKHVIMVREERGKSANTETIISEVRKGAQYSNLRVRFRTKSGGVFESMFNASGLRDETGNLLGMICVGQDLSPIRELEAKLLHYERLAGLGQMAAGVIHELNNPLQAIITYSELVKRRLDEIGETDMARRVSNVIDAGERVRRLSRNLISYARPGSEMMEVINFRTLVDEILSFSGYELSRGGVELNNQVPENLPGLKAVKDQIEQVLINLLTNASHACAEKGGGKVNISADARDGWLEIRVEDNGVGINPEHLSRIFEPFFTTKPGGKGTGLGLNIVKSIVERHNGRINVESKPGQGTAFKVFFPLENV